MTETFTFYYDYTLLYVLGQERSQNQQGDGNMDLCEVAGSAGSEQR